MLAPAELLARAPLPVILMNDHAGGRRIFVDRRRVPAIAIGGADDACRRAGCGQGQGAGAEERASRDFAKSFMLGLRSRLEREITEDKGPGSGDWLCEVSYLSEISTVFFQTGLNFIGKLGKCRKSWVQ